VVTVGTKNLAKTPHMRCHLRLVVQFENIRFYRLRFYLQSFTVLIVNKHIMLLSGCRLSRAEASVVVRALW